MASGSERYQCTVKTTHYANVTRLTKRWCFQLTWHVWPLGHFLLLLRPLCWDELWGAGCVKWLVFSLVGLDDWGLPGSGHIRGLCPGFIPIWRGSGPCCDCGAAHSCCWPARACNDSGTVYVVTWNQCMDGLVLSDRRAGVSTGCLTESSSACGMSACSRSPMHQGCAVYAELGSVISLRHHTSACRGSP